MFVCCGKKQKKSQIGSELSHPSSDVKGSEEVGDENKISMSNLNGKGNLP
jgi:hypothetical protein